MGFHTYPVERADALEDAAERFRYCSAEELVGHLAPAAEDVVADLGSGTGFYTDVVAPHVARIHAVDVQPGMHAAYREKGVPATVALVTAAADDLPFADGALDGAVTTMSYHEFGGAAGAGEVARVLRPGARFVVVDWRAGGSGAAGPPTGERYSVDDAVAQLQGAGFAVTYRGVRPETYVLVAAAP